MQTKLLCLILISVMGVRAKLPAANTTLGYVVGIFDESISGKKFNSFLGIPYAEPPVENLRFKDPVPRKRWGGFHRSQMPLTCLQTGFLDAFTEGNVISTLQGSEDCLYLNVHTSSNKSADTKLPVMVFIHGGGFIFGGTHEYLPHVLMDKDIVLIVIQYRLGIFGFLSTEDSVMPGNMGLKDQQLALKWVKENAEVFGGDPDTITIFGESAGAASVHYHMLSPGSEGLFKRAILQSGTALAPWGSNENHRDFAIETGKQFNCSIDFGTETYLECMQNVNPLFLLLAAASSHVLPRVDGDFLPDSPETLMMEGKFNKVDVMAGITRDEGIMMLLLFFVSPIMTQNLNQKFELFGPISLARQNEEDAEELSRKIYQYYLKREDITVKPADEKDIVKLHTDNFFQEPHDTTVNIFINNDMNVYLYQLDHLGERSYLDFVPDFDRKRFISHGDDLTYMFEGGPIFSKPLEREEDLKLREIILTLWTNFAESGNPNSEESDFLWEKATSENFDHLSLTPKPRMEQDTFIEERKFWSTLKTERNSNMQKFSEEEFNFEKEEL